MIFLLDCFFSWGKFVITICTKRNVEHLSESTENMHLPGAGKGKDKDGDKGDKSDKGDKGHDHRHRRSRSRDRRDDRSTGISEMAGKIGFAQALPWFGPNSRKNGLFVKVSQFEITNLQFSLK